MHGRKSPNWITLEIKGSVKIPVKYLIFDLFTWDNQQIVPYYV